MRAVKSSNLHIAHQCPQCGAPATLLESDRLFACAYCRVTSYLLTRGVSQYRLLPKEAGERPLIYFPYWRFKGMLFSCLPRDIQARFIDTSHQACLASHFPVSLGLRSQALTLGVVTAETPGYFIKPQAALAEVMRRFTRRFNRDLAQPLLHQAHIGESVSLIYAPYYLDPGLVDAVLDQPLPPARASGFHLDAFPGGRPRTRFDFIPTLCPQCGWDLEGSSDAQVLTCGHCRALWQPGREGFRAMPAAHLPTKDRSAVYLPFWRIRADVGGVALASYADLVRLANLPKAVQKAWEKAPFHFWSPAFKLRPKVFLRLIQVLTAALPLESLERRPPDHPARPANLPLSEAAETLKLNLAGFIKPLERMATLLSAITVTPRKALLVYLPFEDRPHELVSTDLNLAINKNQLALAGNL
jgi:hypothetical protein